MTKLATTTVGAGGTSTVTFSNIPQGYTDLVLRISARSTRSDYTFGSVSIVFNSVTSGYSYIWLKGDGSNPNNGSGSSFSYLLDLYTMPGSTVIANTFGNNDIYISKYSGNNLKSISIDGVSENNATLSQTILTAGSWSNSSPITSITLTETNGNNFVQYSTFTLYGIKNAQKTAGNSIKATGGNIVFDGTYVYHVFNSTGAFVPTQSILADVLVVAGGGAGSAPTGWYGGGGGAGGLVGFTNQSFYANITQTVTIGAGGTGVAAGSSGAGTNGVNSQVGSLTAAVGGGTGGAAQNAAGASGGSGGGGIRNSGAGGTATSGQGNAGGAADSGAGGGGGGGGSGAVGSGGNAAASGGPGGVGSAVYSSWGIATGQGQNVSGVYYFAGGGGGCAANPAVVPGGLGGGGVGSGWQVLNALATAGTANTGGGGGGAVGGSNAPYNGASGAGGSGIVIVRYRG
jgi:hypothetical protein